MNFAEPQPPIALSRWTSRVAIFSVVLMAVAFILHRFFGMPTAVALNTVALGYIGLFIAALCGIAAAISIWRNGGAGTARVVVGLFLSVVMFSGLFGIGVLANDFPKINDVTTDTQSPPRFSALMKERDASANPPQYPGGRFAAIQKKAYPDLRTMEIDRPADETFDLVSEAVNRLRMRIVRSAPPGDSQSEAGIIEAVDRTLVTGFYDDVAIRITRNGGGSLVDIRSASRYGISDFGRNAERIREMMREIAGRLLATVPAARDDAPKDVKAEKDIKKKKKKRKKRYRKRRRRR